MPRFYEPDLPADPDSPFARDASNKLVRRGYSNGVFGQNVCQRLGELAIQRRNVRAATHDLSQRRLTAAVLSLV